MRFHHLENERYSLSSKQHLRLDINALKKEGGIRKEYRNGKKEYKIPPLVTNAHDEINTKSTNFLFLVSNLLDMQTLYNSPSFFEVFSRIFPACFFSSFLRIFPLGSQTYGRRKKGYEKKRRRKEREEKER